MAKELREYQQKIVDKVLRTNKDYIICLPTGAGKTVVASAIIDKLNQKGFTVIFIVPRLELIHQAKSEFGECDFIWKEKTKLTGNKKIIASKDSLRTQTDKVKDIENIVLLFDECHIGLEQTFKLCKSIPHSRVLGLTATPERMDGKALLKGIDSIHSWGCFDELLQEETINSLIKKKFLSPLKYYTKPIENVTEIVSDTANGEELSESQMIDIFNKNQIWGDIVESYEKYAIEKKGNKIIFKRPALGFTSTIDMAKRVCNLFTERGYKFEVISGEMNVKTREELITKLKTGVIDGLVNASLLTYGFDCPPVSYAFLCRHIKSRPLWFQIVGRILRICEGKDNTIFVDHGDTIAEFEELDNALPILDPAIIWKVNGETKQEKIANKKKRKTIHEAIKELQFLEPISCELVQVTPEDTCSRLVRVNKKLRLENQSIREQNEALENTVIELKKLVKKVGENYSKKEAEINYLKKENDNLSEAVKGLNAKQRYIDKEETKQWVRRNYIGQRNLLHNAYGIYRVRELASEKGYTGNDNTLEHCLAVDNLRKKIKQEESNLPYLFDYNYFEWYISWWEKNFTHNYSPRKKNR